MGASLYVRGLTNTETRLQSQRLYRVVQGSSVEVSFFNAKECLPWGPIALALRSGTPLIGAFDWYGGDQHIYGVLVSITLRLLEERRSDPEAVISNTASGSSCVSSKNANARSGVM